MERLFSYLQFLSLLVLLSVIAAKPSRELQGSREEQAKLSVLLIASFFTGHQLPLIALGEELVRRGHHVTMMGPVIEGSSVLPDLPEKVGIRFITTVKLTEDPAQKMSRVRSQTHDHLL